MIEKWREKKRKKPGEEGKKRRWKRVFFSTVRASEQHSNFFSLVCSPVMMTVSFARSLSCVLIFSCLDRRRCCRCCLASFFVPIVFHSMHFLRETSCVPSFSARAPNRIFWSIEKQYFGRFNLIKINYAAHKAKWRRRCWRQRGSNGFQGRRDRSVLLSMTSAWAGGNFKWVLGERAGEDEEVGDGFVLCN